MMEELYAKFLPQFTELARERMQRAHAAAAQPDVPALTVVMRDLHAIAGEAGLLGLARLVPIARAAEEQAKRLRDAHPGTDAGSFIGALNELESALAALGAASKPAEGS
jgi:HPt (histidine-containing phosphotransfer) domain-containing protein